VSRDFKDSLVRTDQGVDPDGAYATFVNPLSHQNFSVWEPGRYYDPVLDFSLESHNYVTKNEDSAKRKYEAVTVTLDRILSNSWSVNMSYTHASLKGNIQRADSYDKVYYNKNLQTNSYGNLPGVNDNEFKARGMYELPWNMRVSGTFTYLSGTHWTPTYRTDSYNGTRYAVNLEPLGSQTYPSRTLLDLRVTQMFNFTKKARMEVFVEVLNVLNRQSATSYITRANSSTSDTSGVYIDYKYPSALDPGRRLQLGARYNF